MKITLTDFGPISHFEFDLDKDLHVIFGENNIGKSYAITAVYLILKNLIEGDGQRDYIKAQIIKYTENKIAKDILEIYNENKTLKYIEINIAEEIRKQFGGIFEGIFCQKIGQSLISSFSSLKQLSNKRTDNVFEIEFEGKYFNLTISINELLNRLFIKEIKINTPIELTQNFDVSINPSKAYSLDFDNKAELFSSIYECIEYLYDKIILNELSSISNVYFLPAFRSGLYQTLNSFSSIFAELSKNRHLLTKKIEIPGLTAPSADYILSLSNINNKVSNDYGEFVKTIEDDILKGSILLHDEAKKIVFRDSEIDEDFDLSFISSMASEISIMVAFLKYVITIEDNKHNILFIEEPEAHLHPEVQVKLMEIFALLADKNLKIVMTSHSNYMFNKLSNLILDGKIDYNKVGSYLMRATEAGSITDTLSMKAEVDGMNDENFADVAEMLYEERIQIYDKLNKATHNAD